MKVKATNYRQYLLHRIGECRERQVNYWVKVIKRKKEYESHWFSKLFNLKFFESEEWRWTWYAPRTEDVYKKELNKVLYHIKLNDDLVELDEDFSEGFYTFARLNGLP